MLLLKVKDFIYLKVGGEIFNNLDYQMENVYRKVYKGSDEVYLFIISDYRKCLFELSFLRPEKDFFIIEFLSA